MTIRHNQWRGFSGKALAGALAFVTLAWTASVGPASAAPTTPGSTHFPRYKELEPNVAFWSDVFTKWTSRQIAFHDVEHLHLVYSVLSVDDIVTRLPGSQQDDAIRARRKAEGERITAMLERIASGHARTEEERRILKSIAKIGFEPSYAKTLAGQVRSQRGLGDRFCEAAARAETYRPMMSRILRSYDVPQELLALPVVESGYTIGAYSSAGAAGIWQFMPATGRLYLQINSAYDDRRDPARSTAAAARMLRKIYDNIGSWPLAITSYNHGPGGVARAVKEMGTTHFGVISRNYKGKSFGFASRNYYAEFLAAADAMKRLDQLCGTITVTPYQPDEAVLGTSASIRDLARAARLSVEELADLNPALSPACQRGTMKVPRGYHLNLPYGTSTEFAVAFGHVDRSAPTTATVIARSIDPAAPALAPRIHTVGRGETLGQIAREYGTTETKLLWMNDLRSSSGLKAGQDLKVPGDRAAATIEAAKTPIERPPFSKTQTTTAGIIAAKDAAKEASATAAAAAREAIGTAATAAPAAVVQSVPARAEVARAVPVRAEAAPAQAESADPVLTTTHKVGRGQTLSQIASMYRTSVSDLKSMNGITEATSLQAGQTLKVRASGSEIVANTTVGRSYKVRSGDTLWSVAKANDTSVETLKRLNPKLASVGLKAGGTIKVPSAGAVASAPSKSSSSKTVSSASSAKGRSRYGTHRVQKGQTLSGIAHKYNTSVDALKRLNGIRDARSVQVGKTLKVPL